MQSFHHNIIPWTAGKIAMAYAFMNPKNYDNRTPFQKEDDKEYHAMLARVAARKELKKKEKLKNRLYNAENRPAACRFDGGLRGGVRRWR